MTTTAFDRFTLLIESVTGNPSTPEQIHRVVSRLYALIQNPTPPEITDEQKAESVIALIRMYLRSGVHDGAQAQESLASIDVINAAAKAAVDDV